MGGVGGCRIGKIETKLVRRNWIETELMVDNFKAHDRKYGPRLEELQGLGRRGGIKFVDDAPAPAIRRREVRPVQTGITPPPLSKAPDAGVGRSGPKGGRPGLGEPWVSAGISRAEYFRRRKKEAGGAGE